MKFNVNIDKIVLYDSNHSQRNNTDYNQIKFGIESELGKLIKQHGNIGSRKLDNLNNNKIDIGNYQFSSSNNPYMIGKQIGSRLYRENKSYF